MLDFSLVQGPFFVGFVMSNFTCTHMYMYIYICICVEFSSSSLNGFGPVDGSALPGVDDTVGAPGAIGFLKR